MNAFDAYIIGCIVGMVFAGIGFMGWYWLGWLPKRESRIAAYSRGFDAGWHAGWNSRTRIAGEEPDLIQSLDAQWDFLGEENA